MVSSNPPRTNDGSSDGGLSSYDGVRPRGEAFMPDLPALELVCPVTDEDCDRVTCRSMCEGRGCMYLDSCKAYNRPVVVSLDDLEDDSEDEGSERSGGDS